MDKMILIADDLTGAVNAASYFVTKKKGMDVYIDTENINKDRLDTDNFFVANSNTRNVDSNLAYGKTFDFFKNINLSKFNLVKKIDTAFRGNIGREIEAVFDSTDFDLCFILNSIPAMGRITIGGYQLFGGKPLEQTPFSNDQLKKIDKSYIPQIIREQTKLHTAVIELKNIRGRRQNLKRLLERKIREGSRIIVFDSASMKDIDFLVHAFFGKYNNFWAGSLGLIESIKDFLKINNSNLKFKTNNSKILGFCASRNNISKQQIFNAEQMGLIKVLRLDINRILDSKYSLFLIRKEAAKICNYLKKNNVMLIPKVYKQNHKDLDIKILEIFIQTVKKINCLFDVDKIILIGGDTSFNILSSMDAKSIKALGNISPGIDYGIIADGRLGGKYFLIKGGSVGNINSLIDMINF